MPSFLFCELRYFWHFCQFWHYLPMGNKDSDFTWKQNRQPIISKIIPEFCKCVFSVPLCLLNHIILFGKIFSLGMTVPFVLSGNLCFASYSPSVPHFGQTKINNFPAIFDLSSKFDFHPFWPLDTFFQIISFLHSQFIFTNQTKKSWNVTINLYFHVASVLTDAKGYKQSLWTFVLAGVCGAASGYNDTQTIF